MAEYGELGAMEMPEYVELMMMDDEGVSSTTSVSQMELEELCARYWAFPSSDVALHRDNHERYLSRGLFRRSRSLQGLDASRPWLVYWRVHGLDLLGRRPGSVEREKLRRVLLEDLQSPTGGFCGGVGQEAHAAPTYSAVLALAVLSEEDGVEGLDREGLVSFFRRLKAKSGGFAMHVGGEVDVRATYTVVAVSWLTGVLGEEGLMDGVAEYIGACQTYEGGFGGEPGNEAHGGYTFSAVAALELLGRWDVVDVDAVAHWLARCQSPCLGGYRGRTNKLVDVCYSFWQGGAAAIVAQHIQRTREGRKAGDGGKSASSAAPPPSTTTSSSSSSSSPPSSPPSSSTSRFPPFASGASDPPVCVVKSGEGGSGEEGEDGGSSGGEGEGGGGGSGGEAVSSFLPSSASSSSSPSVHVLGSGGLSGFILRVSQLESGGLRDKPGKPPDLYHTCYALSGLSIAQHHGHRRDTTEGGETASLPPTYPPINLRLERLDAFRKTREGEM